MEIDATPSGDATADTATLQAALTAAGAAGGGEVVGPAGWPLWTISTTLAVPSNVTMRRFRLKAAPNLNGPVITNADAVNGNTGLVLADLYVDGNRANQSGDNISPLDFWRVTDSRFLNLDVQGGKRLTSFNAGTGTNGEGIVLRYSNRNEIRGGKYHDNDYDGIKLRTSNHNIISDVTCADNGRAGVQISFQDTDNAAPFNNGEGDPAAASRHNTVSNITVTHATGAAGPGSPGTCGVYLHTAESNTVSNLNCYGTASGIGLYEGSNDNVFSNCLIRHRGSGDTAAIGVSVGQNIVGNSRNTFAGITTRGLSGGSGSYHVRVTAGSDTKFIGCQFFSGDGTGTWKVELTGGTNNLFEGCYSNGSFINTATRTIVVGPAWGGTASKGNLALVSPVATPGGGVGVVAIGNATTAPNTNPTGGGVLYVEAGALKYRGTLGTVTTLGPA